MSTPDAPDTPEIQDAESASTETFVAALVFNAAVFGAEVLAFTLLRPYFKAIYEPRTYVPKKSQRIPPLVPSSRRIDPLAILSWPFHLFKADHKAIKRANGLDAYFFVRFLRMMVKVFAPIWIVTWAVLLPVTSVGSRKGNNEGLDLFVYGNVPDDQRVRFAAHIILLWVSTFWVFYNIKNEMRHFLFTRQRHLIDPDHAKTVQANTVLITGIPTRYLTHAALRKTFGTLPGGVKNIWINRDLKELPEIYERRLKACNKLESAETKLLSTAAKLRLKEQKGRSDPEASPTSPHELVPEVPKDQRPTHKLGFLGLLGEKVDTIEWARAEIRVCTQLLEEGRSKIPDAMATGGEFTFEDDSDDEDQFSGQRGFLGVAGKVGYQVEQVGGRVGGKVGAVGGKVGERVGAVGEKVMRRKTRKQRDPETPAPAPAPAPSEKRTVEKQSTFAEDDEAYPPLNSAFITFRKQVSAHLAGQVLVHHEPYRMTGKHIDMSPSDIIWSNLGLNPYEMNVRFAISWGLTLGLILLWTFPVAFVGAVSNIHALSTKYSWLHWLNDLPPAVVGIISGILPPVGLAILFMLLPIVLRMLATFEGIPKRSGVELSLMTRFFIFQVLHGFLIVTLASGIINSLKDLSEDLTSIPRVLADKLPSSSTFFLTYVILQGLSGTAGGFLQIVPLIIYYVKLFVLGSTPRSVHGIKYAMGSVAWGTLFPGVTLLVVISLGYSIISPIINGLACFTFFAFYQMYKFLFLYCYQQDLSTDTGGLFFPKAVQHVFIGLYVQQICLAALFFLSGGEAIAMGGCAVALVFITIGYHIIINNSYGPLIHALPLTLVDKMYAGDSDDEEEKGEREEPVDKPGTAPSGTGDNGTARGPSVDTPDDIPLRARGRSTSGSHEEKLGKDREKEKQKEKEVPKASETSPEQAYGFAHPAASRPQRIVWIPRDVDAYLGGMGEEEAKACRSEGVEAVCGSGALMNEKGKVDVLLGPEGEGGPPDLVRA
ncbi:phosphate metabolism protein 7 [Marasmius tenuissimus]|uniref:Phosphate metabolism protein 7 n=1 Tax=Marasmius tenuissimus TaxID=585030 RepID=A0ABR3A5H5_9AGAR